MLRLLSLLCFLPHSFAKTVHGDLAEKIAAHTPGWWYIDKFGYDVGKGNVTLLFEIADTEANTFTQGAEVAMYLDEDWPKVLAAEGCESKRAFARELIPLAEFERTMNTVNWGRATLYRRRGISSTTPRMTLSFTRPITQVVRPHYWYFCWVSCGKHAHPVEESRERIYFKLSFTQANGSHTPIDNKGLVQFFAAVLAAYLCGAMMYARRFSEYIKKHKYNRIPDTVYVIPVALGFQIVSVLFELLHLLLYARNGHGVIVLDAFSEICTVGSQVIIVRLLLTYARQTDLLEDVAGWISSAVLAIVTCILAVWSSTYDSADAHDVYHDHHTLPRLLVYVVHAIFAAWFLTSIAPMCNDQTARFGIGEFARYLRLAGLAWFLTPPIFILMGYLVADYWQNSFITALMLTTQSAALGAIAFLSLTEAPLHLGAAKAS